MRHIIALVALATALISTPAFPEWKTFGSRKDNLTGLTHPEEIISQGRLTHNGSPSPDENYGFSFLIYSCAQQNFGIYGITTHQGIPELDTPHDFIPSTLRGVFDGPNRPVNKVEHFTFFGEVVEKETHLSWLMAVHATPGIPAASSGLFEKIKTGEVTSIKIEFPTESGDLVFEYDTDNFPAFLCE